MDICGIHLCLPQSASRIRRYINGLTMALEAETDQSVIKNYKCRFSDSFLYLKQCKHITEKAVSSKWRAYFNKACLNENKYKQITIQKGIFCKYHCWLFCNMLLMYNKVNNYQNNSLFLMSFLVQLSASRPIFV